MKILSASCCSKQDDTLENAGNQTTLELINFHCMDQKKKKHILKYLNLILKESYADFERHEGKCKNLPHLVNFNLYISNKCNSNILQIYGCICLTF